MRRKRALQATLEKYKTDVLRGKSSSMDAVSPLDEVGKHPFSGKSSVFPSSQPLPFLEDTITHLVGRERRRFVEGGAGGSASAKGPSVSRVRAMAMAEAMRGDMRGWVGSGVGSGVDGGGEGEQTEGASDGVVHVHAEMLFPYIRAANSIIGIVSAVEGRVALTGEERMRVARAAAGHIERVRRRMEGGMGRRRSRLSSLSLPGLHGQQGHLQSQHTHTHMHTQPEQVLDCLQLLDLSEEALRHIVSTHPEILFLDVDRHMLPVLAYLSDLGLDDVELVEIVSKHAGKIFKGAEEEEDDDEGGNDEREGHLGDLESSATLPSSTGFLSSLQSGVAFWTGKGLSRASIVNLIKLDPGILEANTLVMQMKVDWLTEHTGLTVEELAAEPKMLSANLGAVTAPRIAWLVQRERTTADGLPTPGKGVQFDEKTLAAIVASDEDGAPAFLDAFGFAQDAGTLLAYETFVGAWYENEFVPWLERKSRMSEIMLQQESEMLELGGGMGAGGEEEERIASAMQAFAAGKEFAWEQQMEREREWQMAWHAWKREQQSLAVAERTNKRHQQREDQAGYGGDEEVGVLDVAPGGDRDGAYATTTTTTATTARTATTTSTTPITTAPTTSASPYEAPWTNTSYVTGTNVTTSTTTPPSTSSTAPTTNHQRSVYFLSRKWTCDATIDEALSQAIFDCEQLPEGLDLQSTDGVVANSGFDAEALSNLSVERVQSCAVNLLLLLRASEHGTLEPKVFYAWASRSGVAMPELTAAKAIISSSGAAYVRSEPSWKYHSVPQKVWRLRDTAFFAPGLLPVRDTRGSRAVADLADLILKSLKQSPNHEPMTRMEISEMYGNKPEFQSKRMRFAIGLLLEQGVVIQRRRRGIASGPMELVLTESLLTNTNHHHRTTS